MFRIAILSCVVLMLCCRPGAAEFLGMSPAPAPAAEFTVTMLDAGPHPGDIFLLRTPGGRTVLIDCGWEQYAATQLLAPLERRGIDAIDTVIISHPDEDHLGGLVWLLRHTVAVGEIIWSVPPDEDIRKYTPAADAPGVLDGMNAVRELAAARGIPVREAVQDEEIDLGGGVTATVLLAARAGEPIAAFVNNNSLILKVAYRNFSMLFTGDLLGEEEALLLERHSDLRVDCLKAGHHAGPYSCGDRFLAATHAAIAFAPMPEWLSCDERSAQPAALLKKYDIAVFRSWEYPELTLKTDGRVYWLEPER